MAGGRQLGRPLYEWRSTGNLSTVKGTHPSGCEYTVLVDNPPHHPEGDFLLACGAQAAQVRVAVAANFAAPMQQIARAFELREFYLV